MLLIRHIEEGLGCNLRNNCLRKGDDVDRTIVVNYCAWEEVKMAKLSLDLSDRV